MRERVVSISNKLQNITAPVNIFLIINILAIPFLLDNLKLLHKIRVDVHA